MRTDSPDASKQWVCNRKKAYPDQRLAAKVARKRGEESGRDLVEYACGHCGCWHIGGRRADDIQDS